MLDRFPIKTNLGAYDTCTVCIMPDSMRHIFFECSFAREIWWLFGLSLTQHVFTFDIITGYILGLKKDANLFWNILSSYILGSFGSSEMRKKFKVMEEFL